MTLEELQAELLKTQEQLATLSTENEAMKTTIEDKTKREKELEEHNQKLFLRVTTKQEPKETVETVVPSCIDEDTYKLLNKRELEELNNLLEEE